MKNPKYFVGAMIAILVVVGIIIRSGENLGSDFEKVRLNTDSEMGLNVKSNTFRFTHRPSPPPAAPKWGSFKSEPVVPAATVSVASDKNQDLLKTLAKKVTDKIKDDKKKQKKVAKTSKKKKGVTLIKTAESRVSRAMRRLDDGMSSKNPPVVPVAFVRAPQKGQASPQSAGAEEEDPEDVRSLADWQAALLRKPDPQETDNLIAQYKQDKLGDKRWAFMLAQEMLDSEDAEIQKQGVKVLDSIPSESSFALLTQNSGEHTQEVNVSIKKSLDRYALYQNLAILEKSVRSTTPAIQIQAAKSIDQSGQLNLAAAVPQARGQRASADSSNAVHLRYQQTVVVLESASQRSKSPEGKAAIDATINSLNQMLSGEPNPQLEIANQ